MDNSLFFFFQSRSFDAVPFRLEYFQNSFHSPSGQLFHWKFELAKDEQFQHLVERSSKIQRLFPIQIRVIRETFQQYILWLFDVKKTIIRSVKRWLFGSARSYFRASKVAEEESISEGSVRWEKSVSGYQPRNSVNFPALGKWVGKQ